MGNTRNTGYLQNIVQYDANNNIILPSLTGTGTRMVVSSSTGLLSTQAIPSLSDLSGVPTSRTLTINGVTYDLTANRTWSALPTGGVAGDILAKIDGTDYNATWIPNYTSQVQHYVKLGAAMTAGTAVYVSGSTGNSGTNMIVSKASNASEATSSKTLGLIATGGITNDIVFVVTEGLLAGLDTSTATAGDPVWLGVDGQLIFGLLYKPTAPAHLVFIGVVTRVQQNNGEIFVKVQNGFELDELHNLSVKNASDGDMIKYVASTGLWTKIAASTTNIVEGTNLYYTQGRFDTAFAAKSTTNLTEGTNLYYTDARVGTYLTNNSYATQTYVNTAVSNLVDAAPGTLDTLNELAAALGDDPNFATTVATSIGTKQAQLNGTGFVKVSGTTVSYDNSTYYLASNPSGYITGNQNITLSGDVTGSGATSIVTTIANNAVTTAKINNGAITAAKLATFGASEGFFWAANTDGASIVFESTSDGASGGRALSNLLIALTDNGDEGLKVTTTGSELLYVNINQFQYKGNNVWHAGNLTNLNQLTNGPGYITGYTETDTLATVTARGATTTTSLTANRYISNATDASGEWYFFRGNSSVSNALTMYTYADNVYTNAYKSYHIRANNTGGTGGYIHLHGGSIMFGTSNAPILHSSTVGVVIQGPSSRGILEIWDSSSGKSVFQNVGGSTYIGQLDKGSGSGITYILVNGNGASADVALTLNANTSAVFNSSVTATSFIKTSGTSSQFLMADGSVSTNPGWVTGGPYLPLTSGGTQILRLDTGDGTEHLHFQNQTSGGYIQLGFQQNDTDGLHHRAYFRSYKSAAGSVAGVFDIIIRSIGGGIISDVFRLEAGQAPKWSGNVMLHASNYSSYNSFSALSTSGFLSATGGSKIVVQNSSNGGADRGLYMWNSSDPNWVIYMATGGATSPASGTTCNALDGVSSHAIRFRIAGSGNSFIWENTTESCLMSLNGADTSSGGLYVKRRIRGSGGFNLYGNSGFYTSYTPDGLFGATAIPNTLSTSSNGGNLTLGYQDNGSGLYSPAYGFDVRSTDGIPVTGRVVKAIVMRDVDTGALPFIVYNNGAIYSAQNIQASKFLVNGDSWIVFNNEEGSWGIKTRTTTSTSKLGSALKNMFYCGGGGSEGFVITGVGTGDPSFEINNNGAAYIKDRLLINTGTHWNNEKLGVQISNGNNLTNVPSIVRLTNNTAGGIAKMTFTDSSIIDGIFCMTPISNGSYWSLGFAGYTEQGLKVYQNGNVVAAGDVTAYSDLRVKENIITIENALDKTLALRGVYYNRTDTEDKRKKIGVIAQEVEVVAPELVTRMEDDMLNVSYGNMAGLFIEAIKEQQAQIESQKTEIEELKDLVKQLINR